MLFYITIFFLIIFIALFTLYWYLYKKTNTEKASNAINYLDNTHTEKASNAINYLDITHTAAHKSNVIRITFTIKHSNDTFAYYTDFISMCCIKIALLKTAYGFEKCDDIMMQLLHFTDQNIFEITFTPLILKKLNSLNFKLQLVITTDDNTSYSYYSKLFNLNENEVNNVQDYILKAIKKIDEKYSTNKDVNSLRFIIVTTNFPYNEQ